MLQTCPYARRWYAWPLALTGSAVVLAGCGGSGPSTLPAGRTPRATQTGPVPAAATATTAAVAHFRLPETLSRAVAVAESGGDLVVSGGLHDGDRSTGAVLTIVPATSAVAVTARLPVAVHDAAGGLLAGVPTTLGGGDSRQRDEMQQPAGRNGSVVGHLPIPTSDAVAVTTDRGLVMVGGYDGAHTLGQVLLITSTQHIERIGQLPVPVRYPAVAVTGTGTAQRVLVIGGETGGIATTMVQEVDPATGDARVLGHLPAPRTQASALTLGGSVFVFGGASRGTTGATTFSDVLRWNPATSDFSPAGQLPYAVADAAAVSPNGRVGYLIGGETPSRVATTIIVRASR